MKLINILIVSFALLLLAGCTTTANVVKETDVAADTTLKSVQAMVHSSDDVKVRNENEVQLYLTNGGFSPAVIEAKAGQSIVVTSYYVDDVHFSIADLGVEEILDEAESFSFTANKQGEYAFICMDCSPMLKGVLVVS